MGLRLQHMASELAALQSQHSAYQAEIKDGTARLLAERAEQLDELEAKADEALATKQTKLDGVQADLVTAQAALLDPEIRLKAVQAECEHLEARKATLEGVLASLEATITTSRQGTVGLLAENQHLQDQIAPLKAELTRLNIENEAAAADLAVLQTDYGQRKTKYEAELAKLHSDIQILLTKRDELTIYMTQQQHEFDLAGKKLGERQLALDAREENLRIREIKVGENQRQIAKNARLLEL